MDNKCLVGDIMKINREHRKMIERRISSLGIHPSQHHLLMHISRKGPSTQTSIAEAMGVSASTIAVSLKKLEKGNYIEKRISPNDSRSNLIMLTKKGEDVVLQSQILFDEADELMFQGISEEGKEQLYCFMESIINNLLSVNEQESNGKDKRECV